MTKAKTDDKKIMADIMEGARDEAVKIRNRAMDRLWDDVSNAADEEAREILAERYPDMDDTSDEYSSMLDDIVSEICDEIGRLSKAEYVDHQ